MTRLTIHFGALIPKDLWKTAEDRYELELLKCALADAKRRIAAARLIARQPFQHAEITYLGAFPLDGEGK